VNEAVFSFGNSLELHIPFSISSAKLADQQYRRETYQKIIFSTRRWDSMRKGNLELITKLLNKCIIALGMLGFPESTPARAIRLQIGIYWLYPWFEVCQGEEIETLRVPRENPAVS
jgi:hypothetical protein